MPHACPWPAHRPHWYIVALGCSEARGEKHFRLKCGVAILVELLNRTAGKPLEFKRDLSSPEGILKCLVAFANTAGGIVVIGVEDGSKNVRGVPDVLASEEKLANLVSEAESERVGGAGLPKQHAPALPGTAGPRRWGHHPRRLD
jgi:hypothetical protein